MARDQVNGPNSDHAKPRIIYILVRFEIVLM